MRLHLGACLGGRAPAHQGLALRQHVGEQDRAESFGAGARLDRGDEVHRHRARALVEKLEKGVLGVGAGQFTQYHYLTAHNSIILVLAETGIVGFALWFAFVGYGFWMMYRIVRFEPEFEDEDDILDWQEARRMALVLLVAQSGFFAAAFFLSRSYVILLYLLAALVVAHHSNVLARFPALGELRLRSHIVRWGVLTMGAVAAFYVVLKVLLAMG